MFPVIFSAILPVFLLVALGIALDRAGWLDESHTRGLMRLLVNVFVPAFFVSTVAFDPALREASQLWAAPLCGFLMIVLSFAVAFRLAPLLGLTVGSGRRTFAFVNGINNYGYLPIPIIIALFPAGDGTLPMQVIFMMGVDLALWSVGVMLVQGRFDRHSLLRLFNPPLVALALSIAANLSGFTDLLPDFLPRFFQMVGQVAIPLGVLLSGATIGSLMGRIRRDADWKVSTGSLALRLGLLPVLVLGVTSLLPLSDVLTRILVIQAAMPSGILPVVITRHFGGREDIAAQCVVTTNLAALVLAPLWITVGEAWLL